MAYTIRRKPLTEALASLKETRTILEARGITPPDYLETAIAVLTGELSPDKTHPGRMGVVETVRQIDLVVAYLRGASRDIPTTLYAARRPLSDSVDTARKVDTPDAHA